MSVFLYCFREREKLLDVNDMVAGSRLTPSYFRVGGFYQDVPDAFVPHVRKFLEEFPIALAEYQNLLTKNRIWMKRTIGVGVIIPAERAIDSGAHGPLAPGAAASATTCARRGPTRATRPTTSRSRSGRTATCTTAISAASRR